MHLSWYQIYFIFIFIILLLLCFPNSKIQVFSAPSSFLCNNIYLTRLLKRVKEDNI